jgi:hypothetical protein
MAQFYWLEDVHTYGHKILAAENPWMMRGIFSIGWMHAAISGARMWGLFTWRVHMEVLFYGRMQGKEINNKKTKKNIGTFLPNARHWKACTCSMHMGLTRLLLPGKKTTTERFSNSKRGRRHRIDHGDGTRGREET